MEETNTASVQSDSLLILTSKIPDQDIDKRFVDKIEIPKRLKQGQAFLNIKHKTNTILSHARNFQCKDVLKIQKEVNTSREKF